MPHDLPVPGPRMSSLYLDIDSKKGTAQKRNAQIIMACTPPPAVAASMLWPKGGFPRSAVNNVAIWRFYQLRSISTIVGPPSTYDSIWRSCHVSPTQVLIKGPWNLGLPEILILAHVAL